jgi:pimeloyl-ACP methyl ester carboxylesterase
MPSTTISLNGQTLVAKTANDQLPGTPVVFVHGITANIELWQASLPSRVRDGRRWVSLSLPGHHPATIDRPTFGDWGAVTPTTWAEWYEAALQQLVGDQPVDVVGWSTGGFTALTLAAHFPQRVRSVLTLSGFAQGRWLGLIGLFQRLSLSSLTRQIVRLGFGSVGRHRWLFDRVIRSGVADLPAFRNSSVTEQTMAEWFAAFAQHNPAVMAELFRKIAQFDLSDRIGRISCPTLIAGGAADPYIPASHTRWIADQVPGAELVLWPGAGHMFFSERTQEYQELLVRWLNRFVVTPSGSLAT